MSISLLYVDDKIDQIQVVEQFLHRIGDFYIASVQSGPEALEIVRSTSYDVVISSYKIADMNGMALLKQIREMRNSISLILLSDSISENLINEASGNGIDYVLNRKGSPIRVYEELAVRIRKAVKRHQREQVLRERAESGLTSGIRETEALRAGDASGTSDITGSTHEKSIRDNLQKYETSCDTIIDSINGFVWIVNAVTMKFHFISPSVLRVWKYSSDELMKRPIDDTLNTELSRPLSEIFWDRGIHHLSAETPVSAYIDNINNICKDKTPILTEVISEYYLNEESDHLEVRGLCREISDRIDKSAGLVFPDTNSIPEIEKRLIEMRTFLRSCNELNPVPLDNLIRKINLIAFAISHHHPP